MDVLRLVSQAFLFVVYTDPFPQKFGFRVFKLTQTINNTLLSSGIDVFEIVINGRQLFLF